MIAFIPMQNGGYVPKIKIENSRYYLLIDVHWFFPANKKDLTLLLKELYNNDYLDFKGHYQLNTVLSNVIKELVESKEYNTIAENKRIDRNIEQIKVFNGLYGGN